MTDEEVICEFMEPDARMHPPAGKIVWSDEGWMDFKPVELSFSHLWYAEERLTDEQWEKYANALSDLTPQYTGIVQTMKLYIHATVEQKIKGLAATLRPTVEAARVQKAP